MRKHYMIDLETLDTRPTAAFVSIGAVEFNPDAGELGEEFYLRVDWESAMEGRTISAATLQWWMKQSDAARLEVIKPGGTQLAALLALSAFLPFGCVVWGNGATFDISILENAYEQNGDGLCPWEYYNVRDVRTVVDLAYGIRGIADTPFEGDMHNALADAKHQARYVSAMRKELRNGR